MPEPSTNAHAGADTDANGTALLPPSPSRPLVRPAGDVSGLLLLCGSGEGRSLLSRLGMDTANMALGPGRDALRSLAQGHARTVRWRAAPRHATAGAAAACLGNWTRDHPLLRRTGGSSSRVDTASIGAALELELLDEGRIKVVDGGGQGQLEPLQQGRARPLFWAGGSVAAVPGATTSGSRVTQTAER